MDDRNLHEIRIGDRVQTTAKIGVLSAPSASGSVIGLQMRAVSGTVIEGPEYWNGQWWWNVDFARGSDGWVAELKLSGISRPVRTRSTRIGAGRVHAK